MFLSILNPNVVHSIESCLSGWGKNDHCACMLSKYTCTAQLKHCLHCLGLTANMGIVYDAFKI